MEQGHILVPSSRQELLSIQFSHLQHDRIELLEAPQMYQPHSSQGSAKVI